MEMMKRKPKLGAILFYVFLLTPFFSILGIRNAMSESLYQAWQIVSVCMLLLLCLLRYRRYRIGWPVGLFFTYQMVILFSNVFNHGISPGIIMITLAAVLIFVLLQTDCYIEMISAISAIITVSLLINFPAILQGDNLMNTEYFIGGKNALGIFLIPGIFLLLINSLEKYGNINKMTVFMIMLAFLTVFVGSSGTGTFVAFCALVLLISMKKIRPKKVPYLGIIFTCYALLLLCAERLFLTDFWFNFTKLLGKEVTLTSRAAIWENAKWLIKDKWLFGAGRGIELSYMNTWDYNRTTYEAHNFILEILMEGGVIALALMGVLFFKAVRRLDMANEKHGVAFIALCVILINGLTESTVNNFFVTILLSVACKFANEKDRMIRNGNG